MAVGVIMFAAWLAFMALTVIAFVVWAYKEGQLKDIEEAKYRMLVDREPEPWTGREESQSSKPDESKTSDEAKGEGG